MSASPASTSVDGILALWQRLGHHAVGRWLFNRLLAWRVPYTGSVRPAVLELSPGYCRARLDDRRAVRNHLDSIHAIALANIAELASGLATLSALPPGFRGILTAIELNYVKKARGTLVAECRSVPEGLDALAPGESLSVSVHSVVHDVSGETVATAVATWRIGPVRP